MSLMAMKAYSAEFKADAVALYLSDPSHTFEGIGNDLGVSRETLRNWVRAERKRTGTSTAELRASGAARPASPTGGVSSESVLEEENKQLKARSGSSKPSGRSCGGPRNISPGRGVGEQPLPIR